MVHRSQFLKNQNYQYEQDKQSVEQQILLNHINIGPTTPSQLHIMLADCYVHLGSKEDSISLRMTPPGPSEIPLSLSPGLPQGMHKSAVLVMEYLHAMIY